MAKLWFMNFMQLLLLLTVEYGKHWPLPLFATGLNTKTSAATKARNPVHVCLQI
jgi:hypothetical protein